MRQYIQLFINGIKHRVDGADAFLTLSDYVRDRLRLCGTKIVCSEGDCGSCSVLCGTIDRGSAKIKYVPIDSCIRFVFQLDGTHIVTVEGLIKNGELNNVQLAMIDCHGSQCGFCTPGFVMTMTGILEELDKPTEEDWRLGLTGNLCRCTGYTPIIEAGQKSCGVTSLGIGSLYSDESLIEQMLELGDQSVGIEVVSAQNAEHKVFCPTTIAETTELISQYPDATIVAGATDLGVQFNKGRCQAKIWIDLNRVGELEGVSIEGSTIVAGARATWTEFEKLFRDCIPEFHHVVSVFGSPQIRHVGTIGGNIINASPIADSLPFLFVCEAELELSSDSGTRTININNFYSDYKQFDLRAGELLTRIRIPLPPENRQLRLYKISRRRDLDISTFTAAIWMEFEEETISAAGVAYGAVGPVVLRLKSTEQFLVGKEFTPETMRLAGDVAVKEISPITDVRGGSDYRLQLARNVLLKFYHQSRLQEVSV